MRLVYILCLLLFSHLQVLAQSGGVVLINGIPYADTSSTCIGSQALSPLDICKSPITDGKERVYSFTPLADTVGTLEVTNIADIRSLDVSLTISEFNPETNKTLCVGVSESVQVIGQRKIAAVRNFLFRKGRTYKIYISSKLVKIPGTNEVQEQVFDCIDYYFRIIPQPYNTAKDTVEFGCFDDVVLNLPFEGSFENCDGHDRIFSVQPCADVNNAGKEFVLAYTATRDLCIAIELFGTASNTKMSLFSSCPFEEKPCVQTTTVNSNQFSYNNIVVRAGITYYFSFSSQVCATINVKLTESDLIIEDCATATMVPDVLSSNFSYNMECVVNPSSKRLCINDQEAVYKLFAIKSDGNECIEMLKTAGNSSLFFSKLSGCPYPNEIHCPSTVIGGGISERIVAPGIYYFLAAHAPGDTKQQSISFKRTKPTPETKPCANALNIGSTPLSKTAYLGDCGEIEPFSDECKWAGSNGLFYRFTASESTCYDFILNNYKSDRLKLTLYEDCSPTCINSVFGSTADNSVFFRTVLDKGKTYYLHIGKTDDNLDSATFFIKFTDDNLDDCIVCAENTCKACINASFENATFEGWEGYTGVYSNPYQNKNTLGATINTYYDNKSLMQNTGNDEFAGADIPYSNPFSGKYSVVMGNKTPNFGAETMRYTFKVDAKSNVFTYYYAVVFEDPNHDQTNQPFFKISVKTKSGQSIDCGNYEVFSRAGIPGFKQSLVKANVLYKPWSAVAIPLNDFIGQEVEIEFLIKDCALGDHFGYAYLDAECSSVVQSNTAAICGAKPAVLRAPAGFMNHLWSNGSTADSLLVSTPGNYQLTVTTYTGCVTTYTYQVSQEPDPMGAASYQAFSCDTGLVKLTGTKPGPGFNSYGWQIPFSAFIPSDTVTLNFSDGVHPVKYIIKGNLCTFEYPLNVVVNNIPPTLVIDNDTICSGQTKLVSFNFPSPNMSVLWFDGGRQTTRSFTTGGVYPYRVNSGSCFSLDTFRLHEFVKPAVSLGNMSNCDSTKVQFFASKNAPGYSGGWELPNYVQSNKDTVVVDFQKEGNYGLNYQLKSPKCTFNYPHNVSLRNYPRSLNLGVDTICDGESKVVFVDLEPGHTFTWNDNVTANPRIIKQSGVFSIIQRSGSCILYDTLQLTELAKPIVTLNYSSNCGSTMATVQAAGLGSGYSSFWSFPNNTKSLSDTSTYDFGAYGSFTSTYNVSLSSCDFSYPLNVVLNAAPSYQVQLLNDTVCNADSLQINITGITQGAQFRWFDNSPLTSRYFKQTGNYSFTVSLGNCAVQDTVRLVFSPLYQFSLGPDTSFCASGNFILRLPTANYSSILWNTGSDSLSTPANSSGNYTVDVRFGPCLFNDTRAITVDVVPVFSLGNDTSICQGNDFVVNTTPPSAVTWDDQSTSTNYLLYDLVNPRQLIGTIVNGLCTYSDSIQLTIQQKSQYQLDNAALLCAGDTLFTNLQVISALSPSFLWSNGANQQNTTLLSSGLHYVKIIDQSCLDSLALTIDTVSRPVINLANFDTICDGFEFIIDAGYRPMVSYQWSTGSNSNAITVNSAGRYSVSASIASCAVSDTITITADTPPTLDLGDPIQGFCINEAKPIGVQAIPDATYLWNTGERTPMINAEYYGTYTLKLNLRRCEVSDEVEVLFYEEPRLPTIENEVCPYDSVLLDLFCNACNYTWSDAYVGAQRYLRANDDFTVSIVNANNCEARKNYFVALDLDCLDLYVPNAFTPDGDGYNDFFESKQYQIEIKKLLIFNRWGEVVFDTETAPFRWSGIMPSNVIAKTDLYLWRIFYVDVLGREGVKNGTVTLLK